MGCCFSSSNNKVGDEKIETIRNKKYQQTAPKTTSQQQPSYTTSELTEEWKSMIAGLIANNEITLHAQAKNREQFQSLREVGDYLAECQAAATELERAWLVFLWITDNISYDVEDFIANTAAEEENNNTNNTQTNTRSTPTDAQSAFISGQAVCAGYADLYRELCTRLGVECVEISGYAKGFNYKLGSKLTKENHQWNAICHDGQWRFVDSTWGAGFVTNDYKFVKNFKPYYFVTPSHIFNETHYSTTFQAPGTKKSTSTSLQEFERAHPNTLDYHVLGLKCELTDDIKSNSINSNYQTNNNYKNSYGGGGGQQLQQQQQQQQRHPPLQLINSEIRTPRSPLVIEYISTQRLHLKSKLFDASTGAKIKNMTLIQSDFSSKLGEFKYCVVADLPEKEVKYMLALYGLNKEPGPGQAYPELSKYWVMLTGDEINEQIPQYNLSFDYHIKLKSHFTQLIKFETNPLVMEFVVPNTTQALFKLTRRDETLVENAVLAQKGPEGTSSSMIVNVALPQPNETYLLKLYAKPSVKQQQQQQESFLNNNKNQNGGNQNQNKNFNYVSQIQLVRADSNDRDSIKYVSLFQTDFKAYVYTPTDYYLHSNRIYDFRCCVRDAFRVALQDSEKKWHQLAKSPTVEQGGVDPPNTWTLSKAIATRGKLTLFVQFDEQKSYNGFCCYEVVA